MMKSNKMTEDTYGSNQKSENNSQNNKSLTNIKQILDRIQKINVLCKKKNKDPEQTFSPTKNNHFNDPQKTSRFNLSQHSNHQNNSNFLLAKLIQKLDDRHERQQKKQSKISQLNQNVSKLVGLLLNKWSAQQQNKNKFFNKRQQRSDNFLLQSEFNQYPPEFQSRLKNISVEMPVQNQRSEVLVWVGKVCKRVLSVGFHLYKIGQLDINKTKAFCSENILRNLIKLPKQIKQQHWSAIDNCLKTQLFPYYHFHYPQTEEKGVSCKLSSFLNQKDTLNDNEYDLCLASGVKFDIQEDGNYNPHIMEFLNFIMTLPNLPPGLKQETGTSLAKLFQKDMERIFEFVECQQQVLQIYDFNPKKKYFKTKNTDKINSYINRKFQVIREEAKQKDQMEFKSLVLGRIISEIEDPEDKKQKEIENQKQREREKMQRQPRQVTPRHKEEHKQAQQLLEYKEKVKSYTSKQIGQKLPQNIELFSKYQIQTGNLRIKNSALMRVITKWCEQLQKCFDQKQITQRQNPWRMRDDSEKYLKKNDMISLSRLLQRQKQIINNKLKQIRKNNYQNQVQFSCKEVDNQLRKFSQEEAIVGQFCSSVFKINENYLIKYLNMLIHGINRALSDFQKLQRWNKNVNVKECHKNYIKSNDSNQQIQKIMEIIQWKIKKEPQADSETPQLITFKIGDLLRCKCSSKEYEISSLYKFVEYLSHVKPELFKILRVKNKLNTGNKDILMNILYRQSIVIEMQLAIKSEKSKFIQCSNRFNHYLYEVQRSEFGPIMQMCNIWINQDQRAKFYLQKTNLNNRRAKKKNSKECCIKSQNFNHIDMPFTCKVCGYCYYECNFYQKHSSCKKCKNQICAFCQHEHESMKNKQQAFQLLKQLQKLTKQKLKICSQLPAYGGRLLDLNSKEKKIKTFKAIIYDKEFYLFNLGSEELQVIQKFKFKQIQEQCSIQEKQIYFNQQIKKWFQIFSISNLVFESEKINKRYAGLDKDQIQKLQKQWFKQCQEKYFIPKYFQKIIKSQKKSAAIIKKGLTEDVFESTTVLNSVFKINFSENKLMSIKMLNQKFPKTRLAVLSKNQIRGMSRQDIEKWSQSLTHLYLNENRISKNISGFSELKKLVELDLSHNQISCIPPEVFQELRLLKQLNLSQNRLHEIQINQEYSGRLKILNISQNRLIHLPESFGQLNTLTSLQISSNILLDLPDSFSNLKNLTTLDISSNQLQSLPDSFGNLINLIRLKIYRNQLQSLPESFGKLINLNDLNLFGNQLISLPESFGQLESLSSLIIYGNRLLNLPKSFGNLTNLTFLNLTGNKISTLPQSFGDLTNLNSLDISWNRLSELHDSFSSLVNLSFLDISSNYLQNLPTNFGELKNLANFNISWNKVRNLPQSFGNLQALDLLDIQSNELSHLPKSFEKLRNLTSLNISLNKLSVLPDYFENFTKLTYLNLCNNEIQVLPASFYQLIGLTSLYIFGNRIKQLPDQFSNNQKLQILAIEDNELIQVPRCLFGLESLTQLRISCRVDKQFIVALDNMPHLEELLLKSTLDQKSLLIQLVDRICRTRNIQFEYEKSKTDDEIFWPQCRYYQQQV